jgi:hypothetical protein
MTVTVAVIAPFQVCDQGAVYGPGAQVTVDDDVALHWRAHGWITVVATGTPSYAASWPNPDHHNHLGADVPPPPASGTNEVQRIQLTGTPNGGSFTLAWPTASDVGDPILYPPTADDIQDALVALPNIGPGNVYVKAIDTTNWTVQFCRDLGSQDVPPLVAVSSLKPSGSTGVTISTVTPGSPTRAAAHAPRAKAKATK